jgi:SsrA-binding protein
MAKKKQSTAELIATGERSIVQNRKARHEYEILEELECGIELKGAEVKSLREGKAQIQDAFGRIVNGEIFIFQMNIAKYEFTNGYGAFEATRPRKLLAHRGEIDELTGKLQQKSLTLVPLSLYFRGGKVKVKLAIAKGKKNYDKRRDLAEKDSKRDQQREIASLRRNSY